MSGDLDDQHQRVADYTQSNFDYTNFQVNHRFNAQTTLFEHQKLGISWMLHRENEENRHCNVRGGLLMFSMGLGKTLCALGVIAMTKEEGAGPTIVIAPASIIYVWESEIAKHFSDLTTILYYGPNRKKKLDNFIAKHAAPPDIVITSYQTVSADISTLVYNGVNNRNITQEQRQEHPLLAINWYRVICDECQYLKNNTSLAFRAVSLVQSQCQWLLSGTPVMNSLTDMYSYLALLDYRKEGTRVRRDYTYTRQAFGRHFGDPLAYMEIQHLLTRVALRRTKEDTLNLPDKFYHDDVIDFNPIEKEFYDTFKAYSRWRFRQLVCTLDHINSPVHGLSYQERGRMRMIVLQQVLGLVFNLRMACCDPRVVIDKIPRIAGLSIKRAVKVLRNFSTLPHCFACYLDEPTVTNLACDHSLCSSCWKALERMQPMRCIVCMQQCNVDVLSTAEHTVQSSARLRKEYEKRILTVSSKTRRILDLAKEILDKGEKVIIVSQWTTYLQLIQDTFSGEFGDDVGYITMTGKIPPKKRQKTLKEFQENDDIKVCFASLGATAEGLTMTAASHIIMADCFWNKAKTEQMSDRIHRIGQERQVHIHSIFIRDTIELKIREIVEQKDAICKVLVDGKDVQHLTSNWLTRIVKLTE